MILDKKTCRHDFLYKKTCFLGNGTNIGGYGETP